MAMHWREKAWENLEAALFLLPSDDGQDEAFPNASASRAYYAAYLAVTACARAAREPFTSTKSSDPYYVHDRIADDAVEWGFLDDTAATRLDWLRGLRIKADYSEDAVDLEEASTAAECAKAILKTLLQAGNS